jgi:HTH-type transcriptional regulator / antitoxin HigA
MPNMTKRSGKTIVRVRFNPKKYAGLLAETLPTVIETEAQNKRLLKVAKALIDKGEDLTPEEVELAKLLGRLIQDFEQKHYKPGGATPREVLVELMAANNLKQADIVHIFGSKGITSEVINGKREISKANAKALAKFFHTSTDLFL